jgi:hypothetical protein
MLKLPVFLLISLFSSIEENDKIEDIIIDEFNNVEDIIEGVIVFWLNKDEDKIDVGFNNVVGALINVVSGANNVVGVVVEIIEVKVCISSKHFSMEMAFNISLLV